MKHEIAHFHFSLADLETQERRKWNEQKCRANKILRLKTRRNKVWCVAFSVRGDCYSFPPLSNLVEVSKRAHESISWLPKDGQEPHFFRKVARAQTAVREKLETVQLKRDDRIRRRLEFSTLQPTLVHLNNS